MHRRGAAFAAVLAAALSIAPPGPAEACTRFLWSDNGYAVMVARTMDWPESTEPILTALPRGMARDGGRAGDAVAVAENPARWTSRYGSVVTTVYGIGAVDGVNEAGLAAHLLYLNATDFGARDPARPGVHAGLWAQYLLDNAATVAEALEALEGVQIVMVEARGHRANVHLAIEDATGDSAIVEFIDGQPRIHHGRQHRIMTNDPSYDEQIALLAGQDFSKPASTMPLPGNVSPVDRFQRAAYYGALLPKPKDEREAVASILAIARNVSVPFGAPYKGFGIYNTEYRTVINLDARRYYFELSNSPNVIWIDLNEIDFSAGQPVRVLDPDDPSLWGQVNARMQPGPAPF